MSYTTLRSTEDGVLFLAGHRRRFEPCGTEALAAFDAFARTVAPGVWVLHFADGRLSATARAGSRLFPEMPVRYAVSPFAGRRGPFRKPAPPCAYDPFRLGGVETLLTSPDGAEIYESANAAVIALDGDRILVVPDDRPRVDSVALAALRERVATTPAPILVAAGLPLVLLNAVKGLCPLAVADPGLRAAAGVVLLRLEKLLFDRGR
ncbi:MAG: hypothetical protein MUE73_08455 [Planctomycetes bacterium]|nr:hypothetical protein [Planctomycetota bacterium]